MSSNKKWQGGKKFLKYTFFIFQKLLNTTKSDELSAIHNKNIESVEENTYS